MRTKNFAAGIGKMGNSFRRSAVAMLCVAVLALTAQARALGDDGFPEFPAAGTLYAEAKQALLKQGLEIAPDRPKQPDLRYHEIDCGTPIRTNCVALFIYRAPDGWRRYVVVELDKKDLRLVNAAFAYPRDGLLAIPPPVAPDIPKFKGPYLSVRKQLTQLGYVAIESRMAARVCADEKCERLMTLPEAQCATDIPICKTLWRQPNGRILEVTTYGELRGGDIYYMRWATRDDVRLFQQ